MNPFLESPLAVPQPGARWRRLHRHPRPVGDAQSPGADSAITPPGAQRDPARRQRRITQRSPLSAKGRLRAPLHAVRGAFRLALIAGAILAPGMAGAIDVNAATSQQLQELKGIGPKMASVIIEERDRGGRYASLQDLSDRVKGIGPKKAAALQASGLVVGAAEGARPMAAAGSQAAANPGRRSR